MCIRDRFKRPGSKIVVFRIAKNQYDLPDYSQVMDCLLYTSNQVDARCKKAWERIKGEIKGDTAVVAHGGTLAHFIVHLLEGQPDAAEIVVGNASITTIEYDPVTGQCSLEGDVYKRQKMRCACTGYWICP